MFFVPEKFKKEQNSLDMNLIKDLEKFVEANDTKIFQRMEVGFSPEHVPGAEKPGVIVIKDKPTGEVLLGLADNIIDKFNLGSQEESKEFVLYNAGELVFMAFVMAMYDGVFKKEDVS